MSSALPLHVIDLPNDRSGAHGTAPTFVLLHGYGGCSYTWHAWSGPLARRGRVILVDMKGFGQAPKPDDGRYGPRDLAGYITDLIVQEDLWRVTLIGHSLGGGVSLLTALGLRDRGEPRLSRLVLVGAAAYRQKPPPFVKLAEWPRLSTLAIRLLGPARLIRFVLRSIVHDPDGITEEQVEAYAKPLRTRDGIRALLDAGRSVVPEDIDRISERYREIDLPSLLLWGHADRVIPLRIAYRLSEELPAARLEILDGCGHIPPEELPERSLAVVESFLGETDELSAPR